MRTLLVIGGTGTNGRALIDSLAHQDIRIRALVRDRKAAEQQLSSVDEFIEGDLMDRKALERAFDGVHKAYMVTAVQQNTVDLFANAYAAASAAKIAHFVKFSGLGASLDSPSEVIRQHGASDDALRSSGLPYTILRPNSFHQNMLWQAQSIAESDQFFLPLGDAAQSMIDVRDIADITVSVLMSDDHIGKTYDLTGPESLTYHDVARIIGDVRNKPVAYVPVTRDAAENAMKKQGMPDWSVHALAEIQALFSTGAYADVLPDASRLLNRPLRTFEQFVHDHLSSFVSKSAGGVS